jgi:hypothetical protein
MASENYTFKIDLAPNLPFSQRENTINIAIQKKIDELNSKGYITESKNIVNKTEKFATVSLSIKRMPIV